MNTKLKIIVILGQTSTGKSDFAVQLAKFIDGEIISADSRQVYKGMDLGTGKITKREMKNIPHHMIDVAKPSKIFSVSDYKKQADKKIKEVLKREKIPIIVGGTGFYIDAVTSGILIPEVKPDKSLRMILEKKSTGSLFSMLEKLDINRASSIDKNNRVRLIRAIEIVKALGKVPAKMKKENNFDLLKIGLKLPDTILKEKIRNRLLVRIKKGMIKEIENLHRDGLSWKRMEMLGLEYRYGAMYLQKKISKEDMIEKLCTETWHYAKRQNTWFKKDKDIIWIDPREIHEKAKIFKTVKDWNKQ